MERLYIYPSDRDFTPGEIQKITEFLADFTASWHAHGKKLRAGFEIRYNRFIILWADESFEMPSGCSLDESVRQIRKLENELGLTLFNRQMMYYLDGENVNAIDFRKAGELYEKGEITDQTLVFNPLVGELPQLEKEWMLPFNKSGYYSFVGQLS